MSFIGGIVGGKIQADAAKDATRAQVEAANRQIDVFEDVYDQTREDFAPYVDRGQGAYDLLSYELNPQNLAGSQALPNAPYNALGEETVYQVLDGAGNIISEHNSRDAANKSYLSVRGAQGNGGYNPALPIGGGNIPAGFTPDLVWNDKDGSYRTPTQQQLRRQAEKYVAEQEAQPAQQFSVRETRRAPQSALPATTTVAAPQVGTTLYDDTPLYSFLEGVGADYELTDDYAFRRDEGLKGIERQFAAKGSLNSGAAQKALIRYAEDIASQGRSEYVNRLVGGYGTYLEGLGALSDQGFNANTAVANAGAQQASGVSNALANIGNAQSAGSVARGDALATGVQSAFDFAGDFIGNPLDGAIGGASSFL